MELVRARLGDRRDNRGGHVAVLRREVAGLDAKLFQRVRIRQLVAVVANAVDVQAAIQVKADFGIAAVNRAVDLDVG